MTTSPSAAASSAIRAEKDGARSSTSGSFHDGAPTKRAGLNSVRPGRRACAAEARTVVNSDGGRTMPARRAATAAPTSCHATKAETGLPGRPR